MTSYDVVEKRFINDYQIIDIYIPKINVKNTETFVAGHCGRYVEFYMVILAFERSEGLTLDKKYGKYGSPGLIGSGGSGGGILRAGGNRGDDGPTF